MPILVNGTAINNIPGVQDVFARNTNTVHTSNPVDYKWVWDINNSIRDESLTISPNAGEQTIAINNALTLERSRLYRVVIGIRCAHPDASAYPYRLDLLFRLGQGSSAGLTIEEYKLGPDNSESIDNLFTISTLLFIRVGGNGFLGNPAPVLLSSQSRLV